VKTIGRYSLPESYAQDITELSKLIERYKFKEAQNLYTTLVHKLESEE